MGSCLRVVVRMILMSGEEAEQCTVIETRLSRPVRGIDRAFHKTMVRRGEGNTGEGPGGVGPPLRTGWAQVDTNRCRKPAAVAGCRSSKTSAQTPCRARSMLTAPKEQRLFSFLNPSTSKGTNPVVGTTSKGVPLPAAPSTESPRCARRVSWRGGGAPRRSSRLTNLLGDTLTPPAPPPMIRRRAAYGGRGTDPTHPGAGATCAPWLATPQRAAPSRCREGHPVELGRDDPGGTSQLRELALHIEVAS